MAKSSVRSPPWEKGRQLSTLGVVGSGKFSDTKGHERVSADLKEKGNKNHKCSLGGNCWKGSSTQKWNNKKTSYWLTFRKSWTHWAGGGGGWHLNTVNKMALPTGLSKELVGVILQRRLPGGAILKHMELIGHSCSHFTLLKLITSLRKTPLSFFLF